MPPMMRRYFTWKGRTSLSKRSYIISTVSPLLPIFDGREIEVGNVAVRHIGGAVVEMAAALSNAVAEDADIVAALDVISHAFGKAPFADGRACLVHPPDAPVVGPDSGIAVIDVRKEVTREKTRWAEGAVPERVSG